MMFNLLGSVRNPMMGFDKFNKSNFHTMPTMNFHQYVGNFTNIHPEKSFSSPYNVNKNNQSMHKYVDIFDNRSPAAHHQNEVTKKEDPVIVTSNNKEVNSSESVTQNLTPEKPHKETSGQSEQAAAVMCKTTRKRCRRRRKSRRKNKSSGKHCKNNEKEHKHSKQAENEQTIKDEKILMDECDYFNSGMVSDSETELMPVHTTCLLDFIPQMEIISVNCMDKVNCAKSISFTICPPNMPKIPPRERQLSIAESEDSYIVFDSDSDDLDFADDDDSTLSESDDEYDSDVTSSSSVIPCKRVRFADSGNLCEIHPMIKWSYAYQAARKGPWEEYARDRERFKKRINESEPVIGNIFKTEHRNKIYSERFNAVEIPMEV